jgi:broad specificity phosphatase PhoE
MILIRHGEKQYRNADAKFHKHDPGLTEIGVERAKGVAKKLIQLYGEPFKIISSPYRRARETALIMNSELSGPVDEIIIDNNLSEYLGNHSQANLDVTVATAIHKPPHPEKFEDMQKRTKKCLNKMRKLMADHPNRIVWLITHGIIIQQIANFIGIRMPKTIPYLSGLLLQEDSDLLRSTILLFQGELKPAVESNDSDDYPISNGNNFNKQTNKYFKGNQLTENIEKK